VQAATIVVDRLAGKRIRPRLGKGSNGRADAAAQDRPSGAALNMSCQGLRNDRAGLLRKTAFPKGGCADIISFK
jgi:hypothetical protein